ncbi:MAG: isoaspartyl peptidase/L-asparaginase [Labilithrix sp.]|nr:isoaspartyl peptidase/L-asparaginase [Labilithrix sp.]MCW5814148.1 isoaspartyl peptidase/L-asparaginase [Labilithrix sp.]
MTWTRGPAAWSILVHGGAGEVAPARLPLHVEGCARAAAAGANVLAAGGSALDAVQRAVEALEDDPLFNAGTGACLNEDGVIELDAAIMDGADLRAGAVCALPPFRNPIAIARRVMDASRHVLLAGEGAVRFALAHGFMRAELDAMITEHARTRWAAAKRLRTTQVETGGTVGAVARDANGHVAAATSTGGMVNKLAGRVGDSPLVGAGTYADDVAGACSTTGHGEMMMRVCLAKTAVDAAGPPADAVRRALATMEARTRGTGGAILVRPDGSLGLARTTRTMSWAATTSDGDRHSGA